MGSATIKQFEEILSTIAPYMANTVKKARTFSHDWEAEFEETLSLVLDKEEGMLTNAAKGYVNFALDALRLHKRFERELRYINKTYEEVAKTVYHNKDYMFNLYLPGILLSQYLWPHHYNQLQFFRREFVPLVHEANSKIFADVGIGTGFYSRQTLAADLECTGVGFDISEHSISYAKKQIQAFGFQNRWTVRKQNILTDIPEEKFPFVISVEIIEHLEDPVSFMKGIKSILLPGGFAFITAAITAPNADHIYLYQSCDDVKAELLQAGFQICKYQEDIAYSPKGDEPVPRTGAFICQKI